MSSLSLMVFVGLALHGQVGGNSQYIIVEGREPVSLADLVEEHRGTCDGEPVSVIIHKDVRERAGSIVFTFGSPAYGPFRASIPSTYMQGRLTGGEPHYAGIACDGRRVYFVARMARPEGGMIEQQIRYNIEDRHLQVREPRILDR